MTRRPLTLTTIVATLCLVTSLHSRSSRAQIISGTVPGLALVTGARSYSPMVENLDATMAFYAKLGLKVPPPEQGSSYPWDEEANHSAALSVCVVQSYAARRAPCQALP